MGVKMEMSRTMSVAMIVIRVPVMMTVIMLRVNVLFAGLLAYGHGA